MKKMLILTLLLACGSGVSAQGNQSSTEKAGVVVGVVEINGHVFKGELMDTETQKIVSFISHRPVEISEAVIYIILADKRSIQDEGKGFSSLIR